MTIKLLQNTPIKFLTNTKTIYWKLTIQGSLFIHSNHEKLREFIYLAVQGICPITNFILSTAQGLEICGCALGPGAWASGHVACVERDSSSAAPGIWMQTLFWACWSLCHLRSSMVLTYLFILLPCRMSPQQKSPSTWKVLMLSCPPLSSITTGWRRR